MKRLGILALAVFAASCSSSGPDGASSAAGDQVLKDAPKSKGSYEDMPQPPGGIEKGKSPNGG
ncbi:MAG: hypothetical protein JST30_06140 [Armatimonadetes bacterium]|nr:hypothetical protein [Armatimonadota bacterium]